jgi:hypothetical protein
MKKMIIDIDNSNSVQFAVSQLSKDWFEPEEMYYCLKANGNTNSLDFWHIHTKMLAEVSGFLRCTPEQFIFEWNRRCIDSNTKFMGYHCTRHSDKRVFLEKGILPLSEETIKLADSEYQTAQGNDMWERRSQRSPGPWFLLSYKCAKKPDNHFCNKGPEILLSCVGHHVDVNVGQSIPLIIHCAIPYSLLSEYDYFAFCLFNAYFNVIDSDADLDNLFDGYSIDLRGNVLEPAHIVKIEEII